MISGISSSGGYLPQSFVTKVKTSATPQPQTPPPEIKPDADPAELQAPEGDQESLTREFNLFDLAVRQFSQILPRLETANSSVE